ncbi:MAG: DUF5696 domain-containing protein [Oscillospiraceae bacterium]|nr:DUF5696 domain-containing protein [Oscillospiraceae bacterium]
MTKIKRFGSLALALALVLPLAACGKKEKTAAYILPDTMENVASGVVSQNGRYLLKWDDETKCALLETRDSGYIWSTTPYDYYLSGDTNYSLNSPLVIEYYDPSDGTVQTAKALDCIEDGLVSAKSGGEGITLTFYFKDAEIAVAIKYTLREDSLQISLNTSDLEESGKTRLMSVSVTPYLCSALNTQERSNYLFVPSGSGALMYTDEDVSGISREFSGEVYGFDPAQTQLDHPGGEEPVRLPVFGVKSEENALLAVIESEDVSAAVNAAAGNAVNGYSNAYVTFYVRGFNNAEWDSGTRAQTGEKVFKDVVLLSDRWPLDRELSVGYYPLSGEDADYNGMAARTRRWFKDAGGMKKSSLTQQPYHITLVGGAEVQKFTFGVPHKSFLPLTTFEQARKILNGLAGTSGQTPDVLLKGFGQSGLDVGKLAGGFAIAEALGSSSKRKALETFCEHSKIPLFWDFDLVLFTRSGNGFGPVLNSALSADSQMAGWHPLKINVRAEDTSRPKIRLLQRSLLEQAADKLVDFAKNRVSGIGLSTLGSTAYSDYRGEQYALRGEVSGQTQKMIKAVKDAGHSVQLGAANAYAAGLADSISDVPLQNGGYDSLDETIPFYAMVFGGSVPLYTTAQNLSPTPEKQLLAAVEAGISPSFTLSWSYDTALVDSSDPYWAFPYENNRVAILETVGRTADFYRQAAGSPIKFHHILPGGVTETVFENGVTVTVNHSDSAVLVNGKKIAALDFYYEPLAAK